MRALETGGIVLHHRSRYDAPMPAKYPRLTITMRPGLHALLRRLSELTGQSQSALIFELLDGAEPVLTRVIRLLEAATLAKDEMRGKLAQEMQGAQERIEQQLALSLDAIGETDVGELLNDQVDGPRRRRRKVARGAPLAGVPGDVRPESTPLSNRGVRSLTSNGKVLTITRRAK
jgi:hypothetical protein